MNLVNSYIFAPPVDLSTNTEIGGVSATISTAAALATKLGISVGRISNFTIVGSDIKCRITGGSYAIPLESFYFLSTPCTYYKDSDYLVNAIGNDAFYATNAFVGYDVNFQDSLSVGSGAFNSNGNGGSKKYLLKNATTVGNSAFANNSNTEVVYIPSCATLGSTVGNNSVFLNLPSTAKIYAHPSLATNNGGLPDGDLTGRTVSYVTNFTSPSPITTLAAGTIYSNSIQLNFTPPSSTNTIDYYECYANGILKNKITGSGQYINLLSASTNYEITLVAVDIFYNKSATSNILNVSTNITSPVSTTGLISYYKLDANSNDSFGGNNGSDTGMSYASGKVNNSGGFSGSGYIQGTPILGYTSFTISCWINTTEIGEKIIFSNRVGTNAIIQMGINAGKLVTRLRSTAGTGIVTFSSLTSVNTGTWKYVSMRFDIATGTLSNFVNGVFDNSTSYTGGSFSGFTRSTIGVDANDLSYGKFIGKIDEVSVYNISQTNAEILRMFNSGNGMTY